MTHIDEGTIQAFLDDELSRAERADAAEHLKACAACRAVRDELSDARTMFSAAASLLDPATPAATRAPGRADRGPRWTWSLARAAGLVLLLAAAASAAVPGSPVREWLFPAPEVEIPSVEPERSADNEPTAAPPASVVLEGVVRARGGDPLSFAQVTVAGGAVSAWTDESGVYRLEGGAGEEWRVRATHPGHAPVERAVELPAAGRASLDFALNALPGPRPEPLADFRPFHVAYTLPALLNGDEIIATIERLYAAEETGRPPGGEAVLLLWLDEKGRVARGTLSESTGDARLDSVALDVSRDMQFRPARNREEAVRVIVQIPVIFDPDG